MKKLVVNFSLIHDQNCIIIEERNESGVAIRNNVLSKMNCHECEYYKVNILREYKFNGYLGDIYTTSKNVIRYWSIFVKDSVLVGTFSNIEIFKITDIIIFLNYKADTYIVISDKNNYPEYSKEIVELCRLLCNGLFYYATDVNRYTYYDLTESFDKTRSSKFGRDYFIWNRGMIVNWYNLNINYLNYVTPIICGSVDISSLKISCNSILDMGYTTHELAIMLKQLCDNNKKTIEFKTNNTIINTQILLISRLSWVRAGTRFQVRGLNDNGFVANFVETEQVIYANGITSCFTQIRGSVPLFWSQDGLYLVSHKFEIDRSLTSCKRAFIKHFQHLKTDYNDVIICNLLGSKKDEAILTKLFTKMCNLVQPIIDIKIYHYDFNTNFDPNCADTIWNTSLQDVREYLEEKSFFVTIGDEANGLIINKQNGVVRTNCVDCLDRTNAFQTNAALTLVINQFKCMGIVDLSSNSRRILYDTLKSMWYNNGNNCSLNYAGTNALDKSKSNVSSIIKDTKTSLKRAFVNNFMDNKRNNSISQLCLINQRVTQFKSGYSSLALSLLPYPFIASSRCPNELLYELLKRCDKYIDRKDVFIYVGSWNLAGGVQRVGNTKIFANTDINDWLLDSYVKFPNYNFEFSHNYSYSDIIVIGFQEIIDLTASNILLCNDEQLVLWGEELTKIISRHQNYTLLSYHQLVGVCVYVFTLPQHFEHITDLSISSVKTGFGGTTGNKGGVGVSMTFYSTTLCFVCSHLAAGTSPSCMNQRNQDYNDITNQLLFDRDRTIFSHDIVIWLGDLNYRLNLQNEQARNLISTNHLDKLLQQDQLHFSMNMRKAFANFKEGPIKFYPTYKYEFNSHNYDTSEKNRTPSYTDRILYWESHNTPFKFPDTIKQVSYGRTESVYSDHKPVFSLFQIGIKVVNYQKLHDTYVDILLTSKYGQLTVKYILEPDLTSPDVFSIPQVIESINSIIPGYVFYRHIGKDITLTYPSVNNIQQFPLQIRLPGYKLILEIIPSKLLVDVERKIIKSLTELIQNKNKFSQHKKKSSDLIFFDQPILEFATIPDNSRHNNINPPSLYETSLFPTSETEAKEEFELDMIFKSYTTKNKQVIAETTNFKQSHSMVNIFNETQQDHFVYNSQNNFLKSNSQHDIDHLLD